MILLDDIFIYQNSNMPNGAREMVCRNPDCTYTILINSKLSQEMQNDAVLHAIRHIESNDFERVIECGIQKVETQAHNTERRKL